MSWVVVTLDTTPPVLTWGAASDAIAGFTMSVGYALNEGAVLSAVLGAADGRTQPMVDMGNSLAVDLPVEWPDGASTITAVVGDDVGNRATYRLAVAISGIPVAPPPAPVPAPPASGGGGGGRSRAPARRPAPREQRQRRAGGVVRTTSSVRRAARTGASCAVDVRHRTAVQCQGRSELTVDTTAVLAGRRQTVVAMRCDSSTEVRRRDDPGSEAALMALGIL